MATATEELVQMIFNQLQEKNEAIAKLKAAETKIKELEVRLKEKSDER